MSKPRLLDLFCGAGGSAVGYARAGFEVVGVDHVAQPHYPFEFHQLDAFRVLKGWPLDGFDAIHASPPCQFFTSMNNRWRGAGGKADTHINLLTPTLELLRSMSVPWVVENVPNARKYMRPTLMLHGGMFGLGVDRRRLFESNTMLLAPRHAKATKTIGVYGKSPDGRLLWGEQHAASSLEEAQEAMGMDWGDWFGVKEAIPPAYTEFIGRQLIAALESVA